MKIAEVFAPLGIAKETLPIGPNVRQLSRHVRRPRLSNSAKGGQIATPWTFGCGSEEFHRKTLRKVPLSIWKVNQFHVPALSTGIGNMEQIAPGMSSDEFNMTLVYVFNVKMRESEATRPAGMPKSARMTAKNHSAT